MEWSKDSGTELLLAFVVIPWWSFLGHNCLLFWEQQGSVSIDCYMMLSIVYEANLKNDEW